MDKDQIMANLQTMKRCMDNIVRLMGVETESSKPTSETKLTGNILQDTDPMPFGKYKGELMQDVPAHYLHWLHKEGCFNPLVVDYIKRNLHALKTENPDLIW